MSAAVDLASVTLSMGGHSLGNHDRSPANHAARISTRTGSSGELVDALLARLAVAPNEHRLHGCTLTASPSAGSIRFAAAKFNRLIASGGDGSGTLLILDSGKSATPHFHGYVLAGEDVDVVDAWTAIAGASAVEQRRRVLGGWDRLFRRATPACCASTRSVSAGTCSRRPRWDAGPARRGVVRAAGRGLARVRRAGGG